jgi:hypothetical protein
MIEQKRKRQSINLVFTEATALRLIKKPTIKNIIHISEEMSLFVMRKTKVYLDKAIQTGFAILDHAKQIMYSFYYDGMLSCFASSSLIYSDTDSIVQYIEDENVYAKMRDSPFFDTSNFCPTHPLYGEFHNSERAARIGLFKSEVPNFEIKEIVVCRPKLYAYRAIGIPFDKKTKQFIVQRKPNGHFVMTDNVGKRAKGVGRCTVAHDLHLNDYVAAARVGTTKSLYMTTIQSKRHVVTTTRLYRKAVSGFDNKRFYVGPNESRAFGNCINL